MDHPHETSAPVGSNSSQKCSPETGEATPTSWTPSFIHVIDDIFTSMMSATSWSFNSWKYLRDLRESKNHMLHSGFSNHDFNVLQYLFCSSQRLLQGKQPKSRITTKLAPVPQTILEKHHQSRKIIKNHQNSLIQSHPGAWCRDRINPHCWWGYRHPRWPAFPSRPLWLLHQSSKSPPCCLEVEILIQFTHDE